MSKDTIKKKAVVYYRVSTAEQAQHGFSLEHQKQACVKYAEDHGFEVVKFFSDEGESAKTAKRPGLQTMLKYCDGKEGRVDAIVVYKVDRLTRNSTDYGKIGEFLQKQGIQLHSTTEVINETAFGKFMGNMMAAIAQLDNDVRSERVREGMIKCAESGRFPHKVTIGYKNVTLDGNRKAVVLDPERAPLVKYILNEFSTGIYMEEELRQRVTAQGLKSRTGREISPQLMHKILTNKFYAGVIEYAGKEFRGTHEPLVSEELFSKNQKLLRNYTKGQAIANARHDEEFPLRNMVICSYCGRALTACWSVGKMKVKYPYYRCYYKQCPYKKAVRKDKLETEFSKFLADITPKTELLTAFKEVIIDVWQGKYADVNKHYEVIHQEIVQLNLEKTKVLELVKKELISDEDFKVEFEAIKQKMADRQIQLTVNRLEEFNIDEAVTFVFNFIETLPVYWSQASYYQKVKLMGLIFPEKPVYDYVAFTTRRLSHIFNAKPAFEAGGNALVALRRIELRFSG